jgi:hypothetical protein
LRERAQSLSDYLAARRQDSADSPVSAPLRRLPWVSEQNGRFLSSEWQKLIRESSESRKTLDKLSEMLTEVMSPGISKLKQSLILSRLSQMAEASAARLAELEWDASAVEEIRVKSLERGIRNLEDALYVVLELDSKIDEFKTKFHSEKSQVHTTPRVERVQQSPQDQQRQNTDFHSHTNSLERSLISMRGIFR